MMMRLKNLVWKHKKLVSIAGSCGLAYITACLGLFFGQRQLIYRPQLQHSMLPNDPVFQMPYRDVWLPIDRTQERLHGWWIPAASPAERFTILPNEPSQILTSPKVMLYHCGVGRNMGDRNYLARVAAFRQLGFAVFVFDYRGYGASTGKFPTESQVYADSRAAWNYLRQVRQIAPKQIVIYGESLGGAIALNLAIEHPDAGGLMMQSAFTSMADTIKTKSWLAIFPIDLILTERFDSLGKIGFLKMPVLFIHGSNDSVVPIDMSRRLYLAAPQPKRLFTIAGAEHVKIYQPGNRSYLKAISRFIELISVP
jgi:uncharacterized protein